MRTDSLSALVTCDLGMGELKLGQLSYLLKDAQLVSGRVRTQT